MKKLLAILLPSLALSPNISNLIQMNSNLVNQNLISKIKNVNVDENTNYVHAVDSLKTLVDDDPLGYKYSDIVNLLDATIFGINVNTNKNYCKDLNLLIVNKINSIMNYMKHHYTMLPTDIKYLYIYLNYAYHYVPLYTMFPLLFNQLQNWYFLNSKENKSLKLIIKILKDNSGNFNTGYNDIHGVKEFFSKNTAERASYNPILDLLSTVDLNDKNLDYQYVSVGHTYYGFNLFYKKSNHKSYIQFQTSPFLYHNDVIFK